MSARRGVEYEAYDGVVSGWQLLAVAAVWVTVIGGFVALGFYFAAIMP